MKSEFNFRFYKEDALVPALDDTARLMVACFGEGAGQSDFAARVSEKRKPLLILAYKGEEAVGFKLGYERSRGVFMSWLGGTHSDYRRKGLAKAMLQRQHSWCKDKGYHTIVTESTNDYKGMLVLNIKEGFQIVGTQWSNQRRSLGILFSKSLRDE